MSNYKFKRKNISRKTKGLCSKFIAALLFAILLVQPSFAEETDSGGEIRTETPTNAGVEDPGKGSIIISLAGVITNKIESGTTKAVEDNTVSAGFGVLAEFGVNDNFGLETGVLFVNRQYEVTAENAKLVQETRRLHIPILARAWLSDYLSFGAGPFLAVSTGDEDTVLIVENINTRLSTSADETFEYGLDFAATLNVAVADKTGLFLEGRYSMVLSDEANESADQLSGLAGIKLDL